MARRCPTCGSETCDLPEYVPPKAFASSIPCKGGPHGGASFAHHSFGQWASKPPSPIAYDSHPEGRYVYRVGAYVWEERA